MRADVSPGKAAGYHTLCIYTCYRSTSLPSTGGTFLRLQYGSHIQADQCSLLGEASNFIHTYLENHPPVHSCRDGIRRLLTPASRCQQQDDMSYELSPSRRACLLCHISISIVTSSTPSSQMCPMPTPTHTHTHETFTPPV